MSLNSLMYICVDISLLPKEGKAKASLSAGPWPDKSKCTATSLTTRFIFHLCGTSQLPQEFNLPFQWPLSTWGIGDKNQVSKITTALLNQNLTTSCFIKHISGSCNFISLDSRVSKNIDSISVCQHNSHFTQGCKPLSFLLPHFLWQLSQSFYANTFLILPKNAKGLDKSDSHSFLKWFVIFALIIEIYMRLPLFNYALRHYNQENSCIAYRNYR